MAVSSIDFNKFDSLLCPCKECGCEAHFEVCTVLLGEYSISINCNHCDNKVVGLQKFYGSLEKSMLKLVDIWNKKNDISSEIDKKLIDFDDDQKAFVCILLYLAGYKFQPEDFSKYIQHSSINIRETFESMTLEQKSKAFVMIGEALGYLQEGEYKT